MAYCLIGLCLCYAYLTIGAKPPFVNAKGIALTLGKRSFLRLIYACARPFHNIRPLIGLFGEISVDLVASQGLGFEPTRD